MKNWIYIQISLCCLSLFILTGASGQTVSPDTSLLHTAVNNANALYIKTIGEQSPLNNGPEYSFYNSLTVKGSAYLRDTTFVTGDVYYDGAEYHGVQLLYDIYKDQLLSVLDDKTSMYVLLNERVQNFDLLEQHFININTDTLAGNTVLQTGYYNELYRGKSEVLSKKSKNIQSYTSTTGAQEAYSYFTATKEDFFIRKNNIYYKVSGKGALLSILKDKRKQLQQYINTNKLKFNKDPGQALVSIATYYDHITN